MCYQGDVACVAYRWRCCHGNGLSGRLSWSRRSSLVYYWQVHCVLDFDDMNPFLFKSFQLKHDEAPGIERSSLWMCFLQVWVTDVQQQYLHSIECVFSNACLRMAVVNLSSFVM